MGQTKCEVKKEIAPHVNQPHRNHRGNIVGATINYKIWCCHGITLHEKHVIIVMLIEHDHTIVCVCMQIILWPTDGNRKIFVWHWLGPRFFSLSLSLIHSQFGSVGWCAFVFIQLIYLCVIDSLQIKWTTTATTTTTTKTVQVDSSFLILASYLYYYINFYMIRDLQLAV